MERRAGGDWSTGSLRMSGSAASLERNLAWILLVILFAACLLVLAPFISALLWAVILCYSSWPVYSRLLKAWKGRRTLAALSMSLALVVAVLLPFGLVVTKVAANVDGLRTRAQRWMDGGLPPAPSWLRKSPLLGARAVDYWESLRQDSQKLMREARRFLELISRVMLKAALAIGNGLVQLALSIFVMFFLLRDGPYAADALTAIIDRIGGPRAKRLLFAAGDTVRGVVYGILGTALLQALLAGAGFLVAGVPGLGLLVLLTFFLSVVPGGPPLVFLPAVLWLFSQGSTGWGIFLAIWGLGVSSVDNFIKPWLISHGSDMPFLLIFLGVVGGALAFGFIGVFLGPTLLSVSYRLILEWKSTGAAGNEVRPALPLKAEITS
jgi:predicted PurR-regulated permease PerM